MAKEKQEITKMDVRRVLDVFHAKCRINTSLWHFITRPPENIKQLEKFATPKKRDIGWINIHIPFFSKKKNDSEEKQGLLAKHEAKPNHAFTTDELIDLIKLLIDIRFDSQLTDFGAELFRYFDENALLEKALGNDWENKVACLDQLKYCGLMNNPLNICLVRKAPSLPNELVDALKTKTQAYNGNLAKQEDFDNLLIEFKLDNPTANYSYS